MLRAYVPPFTLVGAAANCTGRRSAPRDTSFPNLTSLRCDDCGQTLSAEAGRLMCLRCGGLLRLDLGDLRPAASLRTLFAERAGVGDRLLRDRSGVWRYRELVFPEGAARAVTYPEGNTPLIEREALARWTGADRLRVKHEGMNPTGSFKDRGMAVALTHARMVGAPAVLCASTGNTSSSMAAYAAIAGIPAIVVVPAGQVAPAKLAQARAYGARTLAVRGDFDACMRLVRATAEARGLYLVNSVNPFRIAGQQAIAFELLEQLGWKAPDWIVLPAGNLGNASAIGSALLLARSAGLIDRLPRLALIQAEGAAPFERSYRDGFRTLAPVAPHTVATAIRIGDPVSFSRAVRVVTETRGVVAAVPDDAILEAKRTVDGAGIGCEPASAASIAGVRHLVRNGTIHRDETLVAILTGNLLKDVATGHSGSAGDVVEIDADQAALDAALLGAK